MNDLQEIRVFVVDDETVIATTLTAILKQSGFDAVGFTNPLQALAAAEEKSPDLLISDVVMPQLSGIDLAIQLKAKVPACKVLLFSGKQQLSTCLFRPAQEVMISRFSPSPSTPPISSMRFDR